MKIITAIDEMRKYSLHLKHKHRIIGFVPTMGFLHQGHLSLVRKANEECDVTAVSIFVNPIQFGPNEDFAEYPRDIDRDVSLLKKEKVDVLFVPSHSEMYPEGYATYVNIKGRLSEDLCGLLRRGHFSGVATVIVKLFNIVMPDKSYFGQKDAQQVLVIKHLSKDLNIAVEIRVLPTVRETDGLAMSSRNKYLSPEEKLRALGIFRALKTAEEMAASGEFFVDRIKDKMKTIIEKENKLKIDYIEVVSQEDLKPMKKLQPGVLVAVAAFAGKTRLIDNIVIDKL